MAARSQLLRSRTSPHCWPPASQRPERSRCHASRRVQQSRSFECSPSPPAENPRDTLQTLGSRGLLHAPPGARGALVVRGSEATYSVGRGCKPHLAHRTGRNVALTKVETDLYPTRSRAAKQPTHSVQMAVRRVGRASRGSSPCAGCGVCREALHPTATTNSRDAMRRTLPVGIWSEVSEVSAKMTRGDCRGWVEDG